MILILVTLGSLDKMIITILIAQRLNSVKNMIYLSKIDDKCSF